MIVITGAVGFIGSNLLKKLNKEGYKDIILVDDFSNPLKNKNIENKTYSNKVYRDDFIEWVTENHKFIQFVIHLGARTDTTEFNKAVFDELNFNYSKQVWKKCVKYGIPLIYASSAATYGLGELGYEDHHEVIPKLKPLNPYGDSKNDFDKWAIKQEKKPFFWAGLKFFNVYGPNEYHKGRMASVIFHAYNQIYDTGKMKLFRSHHPDFKDGEQLRDFIYVKDVVNVIHFMLKKRPDSGIYNVGTGNAKTFVSLVNSAFKAMGKSKKIEFIDTPEDIRDKYQYFTEASIQKLRKAGYEKSFTSLEKGVKEYITKYLIPGNYY